MLLLETTWSGFSKNLLRFASSQVIPELARPCE